MEFTAPPRFATVTELWQWWAATAVVALILTVLTHAPMRRAQQDAREAWFYAPSRFVTQRKHAQRWRALFLLFIGTAVCLASFAFWGAVRSGSTSSPTATATAEAVR